MLAEGPAVWSEFLCRLFISLGEKERAGDKKHWVVQSRWHSAIFEGKLSDLAHGLSWGIIVAL